MRYSKLQSDPLLHLCITEPLRLGSARILQESSRGILAYDAAARLHLLSAGDAETASLLLSRVENPYFILCCQAEYAPLLDRFGFEHSMRCRQWAYLKPEIPKIESGLIIAPPDDAAFDRILEIYRMSTPEELALQRSRDQLFFARTQDGLDAGFVGLHPEGCFGMLQVMDEMRGRGYGAALEKFILRWCLQHNRIPYCQVSLENAASASLQKKLGLTCTDQTLIMAWNDKFQA